MSFSEWGDSAGIDRRKLVVIVISAAVAGAAIVLIALMLFNKNTSPSQAAPDTGGVTAGDAAREAAQPLEVLTTPPTNVVWSPHESALKPGIVTSVPASTQYGPTTNTEALAAGYEQSSAGALIAAAQIATRFGESPSQNAYVIGPGKDEALESVVNDTAVNGERDSFQGFKVLGQPTNQQMHIDLLIGRGAGFQPSACTLDLRWSDGDWRIYAPTSSICLSVQQAVSPSDRASYVQWGPG